jgi:CheY-like chemotaxis protein
MMHPPLILVVEDESIIAALMTDILTSEGYHTRHAATVAEAFALLQAAPPDLIVLDIRLETPEAGWHFLQALRHDLQLATIPVLVCSADVFFLAEQLGYLQVPHTDVLAKPFLVDALVEKVHSALGAVS